MVTKYIELNELADLDYDELRTLLIGIFGGYGFWVADSIMVVYGNSSAEAPVGYKMMNLNSLGGIQDNGDGYLACIYDASDGGGYISTLERGVRPVITMTSDVMVSPDGENAWIVQ